MQEWIRKWLRLRPTQPEEPATDADARRELAEAAQDYRDLVNRPGWLRFTEECWGEAQVAAQAIIMRRTFGETDEAFRTRVTANQEYVAACIRLLRRPQEVIEQANEEGLE